MSCVFLSETRTKKSRIRSVAKVFAMLALGFAAIASQAADERFPYDLAQQFRPIEFTSRAQCSINSASPARSVLIVGDGQDAGRLAFNLKAKSNVDVSETEVLTVYRKAIGSTFKLVVERLLNGELPMISGPTADASWKSVLASCDQQKGCVQLESKIASVWAESIRKSSLPRAHRAGEARLGCHKINQFSALHGHLNTSRPTNADLQEIATLLVEPGMGPTSCDADSVKGDRHFLLQLDLVAIGETNFEKQGFDFWTSVKTYAAWAWRNSSEVKTSMGRFGTLFPSLTLEEEILLVPNGCRSVSQPRCELQRLSLDAIRELAKPPGVMSGFEKNMPEGPQADLIGRGARGVNNGFLGTRSADAQEWVKNFASRFNEARWVSRNKLQGAIRQSRILEKISTETLVKDIESDLTEFDAPQNMPLVSQMAAVCLETRILQDPALKALRPDIESVLATGTDFVGDADRTRAGLQRVATTAVDLAKRLQPLCDSLEKSIFQSRASDKRSYNWSYLSDWARERMGTLVTGDDGPALDAAKKRRGWERPQAYLNLSSPTQTPIEICRSPLACAQQTFKSYVDIYYVSTWAAALQNARKIKDSNLFNPYAELTACKIYDPWYATDRANADLTQRLIISAITAPLPVPLYFESSQNRPKAVALKSSIETTSGGNKELRFDAQFETESSKKTFFADLGPLTGSPCAIQYSNDINVPFQVYGISGVTINYCSDGKRVNSDAGDDGTSVKSTAKYSVCGGCTANVASGFSVAAYSAPPGPLRFLFGAMRAFSLYSDATKDNVNRPITYTVNPSFVADTYRENAKKVPASCTDSLSQGFRCFADTCAAFVANDFEKRSGLRVRESSISYEGEENGLPRSGSRNGLAGVRVEGCDSEILARVRCDSSTRSYEMLGDYSAFSRACKPILNSMKAAK
ncbi:hypothetical protein BH10BDE1_BH10BDE1_32060 [soil metagenome]